MSIPEETRRLCWYELGPPELALGCMDAVNVSGQDITVTVEDPTFVTDPVKLQVAVVQYAVFLHRTRQAERYVIWRLPLAIQG